MQEKREGRDFGKMEPKVTITLHNFSVQLHEPKVR